MFDSKLNGNAAIHGDGGAILIEHSSVSISASEFRENEAGGLLSAGGAIASHEGLLDISGSRFLRNTAGFGASVAVRDHVQRAAFTDCEFALGASLQSGGALEVSQSVEVMLAGCTFGSNTAGLNGGALSVTNSTVAISHAAWTGNHATGCGGAAIIASGSVVEIGGSSHCSGNHAERGGAVCVTAASALTVRGEAVELEQNEAEEGGALFVGSQSTARMMAGTIRGNRANLYGGGISVRNSHLAVAGVVLQGNEAGEAGGGLFAAREHGEAGAEGSRVEVEGRTQMVGNRAVQGGAMFVGGGGSVAALVSAWAGNEAEEGGAVRVEDDGSLAASGCNFSHNHAALDGGAIGSEGGEVEVVNSSLTNNTAGRGGAVLVKDSTASTASLRVHGSVIHGCLAADGGGVALYGTGRHRVSNSTLSECAARAGGAMHADARVEVDGCVFDRCRAELVGGSLALLVGARVTASTCVFRHSFCGGEGGAIAAFGAAMKLFACRFERCAALGAGGSVVASEAACSGAAAVPAFLRVAHSRIEHGHSASEGGAIAVRGAALEVADSLLAWNMAEQGGGAISCVGGSVSVRSTSCEGNTAGGEGGGGIVVQGASLSVSESHLVGNSARGGRGGAVASAGSRVEVVAARVTNNSAGTLGGAVSCVRGHLVLRDVVAEHNAASGLGGGGVHVRDSTLDVNASVFCANSADLGGGGALLWEGGDREQAKAWDGMLDCRWDVAPQAGAGSRSRPEQHAAINPAVSLHQPRCVGADSECGPVALVDARSASAVMRGRRAGDREPLGVGLGGSRRRSEGQLLCPQHSTQAADSWDCVCDAGYAATYTADFCVLCPAHMWCPGDNRALRCPEGTVALEGSSERAACVGALAVKDLRQINLFTCGESNATDANLNSMALRLSSTGDLSADDGSAITLTGLNVAIDGPLFPVDVRRDVCSEAGGRVIESSGLCLHLNPNANATWSQAIEHCQALGGELLGLSVMSSVPVEGLAASIGNVWTGIRFVDGDWRGLDGAPSESVPWDQGHPTEGAVEGYCAAWSAETRGYRSMLCSTLSGTGCVTEAMQPESVFCAGEQQDVGSWDAAAGIVRLSLCTGAVLRRSQQYTVTWDLSDPPQAQQSPPISIAVSGSFTVEATAVTKLEASETFLGLEGGAAPLFLTPPPGYIKRSDGICSACPVDMWCPGGNQQYACPANSTAELGSSGCMCDAGYVGGAQSGACSLCPSDKWCPGGDVLRDCPPNTFSSEGSTRKSDCLGTMPTKLISQTNPFFNCGGASGPDNSTASDNTIVVELKVPADLHGADGSGLTISGLAGAVVEGTELRVEVECSDSQDGVWTTTCADHHRAFEACADIGGQSIPGSSKCFKAVDQEARSWQDASGVCEAWGGTLASIESAEENELVHSMMADWSYVHTWIGLMDVEGSLGWSDGSQVAYSTWGSGEPNKVEEECTIIFRDSNWYDVQCNRLQRSVCSKRVVESPLFCSGKIGFVGEWDPTMRNGTLTLSLCADQALRSAWNYRFSFGVTNPHSPQGSPSIRVSVNGSFTVEPTLMDKPDTQLLGISGGANALSVSVPPGQLLGADGVCQPCRANTWCPGGNVSNPCPDYSTSEEGSAGCVCFAGYFGLFQGNNCSSCPSDSWCPGGEHAYECPARTYAPPDSSTRSACIGMLDQKLMVQTNPFFSCTDSESENSLVLGLELPSDLVGAHGSAVTISGLAGAAWSSAKIPVDVRAGCVEAGGRMVDGSTKCYQVVDEALRTHAEAEAVCEAWGGTLASIESAEENELVHSMMADWSYVHTWIGLKDVEGSLGWSDGSQVAYSTWGSGEPNKVEEECTIIFRDSNWYDVHCSRYQRFLCSKPLAGSEVGIFCADDEPDSGSWDAANQGTVVLRLCPDAVLAGQLGWSIALSVHNPPSPQSAPDISISVSGSFTVDQVALSKPGNETGGLSLAHSAWPLFITTPPGFVNESCALCPANSWCPGGNRVFRCPDHSTSAVGSSACSCDVGFVGPSQGGPCVECPADMWCPGGEVLNPCPVGTTSVPGSMTRAACTGVFVEHGLTQSNPFFTCEGAANTLLLSIKLSALLSGEHGSVLTITGLAGAVVNRSSLAVRVFRDVCAEGGGKLYPGSDKCFQLMDEMRAWHDAEASCNAWGGHLASIDSMAQNAFAHSLITQNTWIGYNDFPEPEKMNLQENDRFWWTDGSPSTYVNWDVRSPISGVAQPVTILFETPPQTRLDPVAWHDQPHTSELPYLCSKHITAVDEMIFCDAGQRGVGAWVQDGVGASQLRLTVCSNATVMASLNYEISFDVINEQRIQPSPNISISASGSFTIGAVPVRTEVNSTFFGVADGAQPLHLTPAPGYTMIDGSCSLCPANSYCPGGQIDGTPPNLFSCPANSSAVEGSTSCTCHPGFFFLAGDGSCNLCPADMWCPGSEELFPCPTNTYASPGGGARGDCVGTLVHKAISQTNPFFSCGNNSEPAQNTIAVRLEIPADLHGNDGSAVTISGLSGAVVEGLQVSVDTETWCSSVHGRWLEGSNKCFQVINDEETTYANAAASCRAWGGHLMSISSEAENELVHAETSTFVYTWTGYNDNDLSFQGSWDLAEWSWEDGSATTYTNWGTNEPDQLFENCVIIYVTATWHNVKCERLHRYMCSMELKPDLLSPFCDQGNDGMVRWNDDNSAVILSVCPGRNLSSNHLHTITFSVSNPQMPQPSPSVSVAVSGTYTIEAVQMDRPATASHGLAGGADPLFVTSPPGYVGSSDGCAVCPENMWCPGGNQQYACPANSTAELGSSGCMCDAGYVGGAQSGACSLCPSDKWCPGGDVLRDCPPNTFSSEGSTRKSDCLGTMPTKLISQTNPFFSCGGASGPDNSTASDNTIVVELKVPADLHGADGSGLTISGLAGAVVEGTELRVEVECSDSQDGVWTTTCADHHRAFEACADIGGQSIPGLSKCFKAVDQEARSWQDASGVCEAWGGTLASIESAEENELVHSMMADWGFSWIRLVDGFAGAVAEPSAVGQLCTMMLETGNWHEEHCNQTARYVCSKQLSMPDGLFCSGGHGGLGEWDPSTQNGTAIFRVCGPEMVAASKTYRLTFKVANPRVAQAAPSISISATGSYTVEPTALETPAGSGVYGIPGGASALFVTASPGYTLQSSESCTLCPVNMWCPGGDVMLPCPEHTNAPVGSFECVCNPGYVLVDGACSPCPANMWCPGGNAGFPCSSRTSSEVGRSARADCVGTLAVKKMWQTNPWFTCNGNPDPTNNLFVTVELPADLHGADGSAITISGLAGAVVEGTELQVHVVCWDVDSAAESLPNCNVVSNDEPSVSEAMFCAGRNGGVGVWDPSSSNGTVTLMLCPDAVLEARNNYTFRFSVTNPQTAQTSPAISISVSGTYTVDSVAIDRPANFSGNLGLSWASDPLFVTSPPGYIDTEDASCSLCPSEMWCPGGNAQHPCPAFSTGSRGLASQAECSCNAGYVAQNPGSCEPCPANMWCPGDDAIFQCPTGTLSPTGSSDRSACLGCLPLKTVRHSNPFLDCGSGAVSQGNSIIVELEFCGDLEGEHGSSVTIRGLAGASVPDVQVPVTVLSDICSRSGYRGLLGSNKCFAVLQGQRGSRLEAQAACQSWGGSIASIESAEENELVLALSRDSGPAWIGYTKSQDVWGWSDGSESEYTNWDGGQPRNWFSDDRCAMIGSSSVLGGTWADSPCDEEHAYICSKRVPIDNPNPFCNGVQQGFGTWVPTQGGGDLLLTLCDDTILERSLKYEVQFMINNPRTHQAAPSISISATGTHTVEETSMLSNGRDDLAGGPESRKALFVSSPPGYTLAADGSCALCPADSYCPGANQTIGCPPTSKSGSGSVEVTACVCDTGFVGPRGGPCVSPQPNVALFGSKAASDSSVIETEFPAVHPGVAFQISARKVDVYGQTVASDSTSVVEAFVMVDGTALNSLDIAALRHGVTELSLSVSPTFGDWDPATGRYPLQHKPSIFLQGIDQQGGQEMKSELVELDVLDCPEGSVLVLTSLDGIQTGQCMRCEAGSYSNEDVAGRATASACIPCPAGATCSGGDDITFALGTWVQKNGLHTLTACPDGYKVLNSTEAGAFSNEMQQCVCNDGTYRTPGVQATCVPCPLDTYFGRTLSDAEGSCLPCPEGSTTNGRLGRLSIADCVCADAYYNRRVSDGAGQTAGVCTPCPIGAMCSNGVCAKRRHEGSGLVCDTGSIIGEWEVDGGSGSYELRSCPPGHELRTTEETGHADHQECHPCTALQYILDPNQDTCKPCPAGLRCEGTDSVTPVVAGSMWVRDNDVLRLVSCPTGYAVEGENCVPCGRGLECIAEACVQCSECEAGTFKEFVGPQPCTACPANTYGIFPGSTSLQNGCLSCPVRSTTRGATGSKSSDACLCLDDVYLAVNEKDRVRECKRCPQGGVSSDGKCMLGSQNLSLASLVGEWARQADGSFELQSCPPGHELVKEVSGVFSHDVQVCRQCQPWEYSLNSQTDSCQPCPKGLRCFGNSTFEPLVPGSVWSPDGATLKLQSCPAGHLFVNSSLEAQECFECEPLTYSFNPLDGCNAGDGVCRSRACQRCPANGALCLGSAEFQITVPGSIWELSDFGSSYMSMRVESCPPGFVLVRTEDPLLDQCVECPRSTYTVEAANFRSRTLTVSDAQDAIQECHACPEGATCGGGNLIVPRQGYWIPPQSRRALPSSTRHQGTRRADPAPAAVQVKVYRCPPGACLEGGECAKGREGPLCAVCSDGYAGTQCRKCSQTPREAQMLVLAIAVSVLLVIWYFNVFRPIWKGLPTPGAANESQWEGEPQRCSMAMLQRLRRRGLWRGITIIISFAQIVGNFESIFSLNWPASIRAFWQAGAILRLDIQEIPGLSCAIAEWKYPDSLMIYALGTPVLAALLYLPTACYVLLSRDARRSGMAKHLHDRTFFICLFLLFLLYPILAVVSVRGFACKQIASENLLSADHSTNCPSVGFSSLWIWVFLAVLCYPCGVPLLFVLLLWRSRVPQMAKRKRQNAILAEMMLKYATDTPLRLECRVAHYVWTQQLSDGSLDDAARRVYDKHVSSRHGCEGLCSILGFERPQEMEELRQQLGADTDAEAGYCQFLAMVEDALFQLTAVTDAERLETISVDQLQALCRFRWLDGEAAAALGMLELDRDSVEKMKEFLLKTGEHLLKKGMITLPMLKWDRNISSEEQTALDRFGFLIESYRVEFWYWEIFEMVRKFFMTGLILHVMPDSPEQVAAGFVISGFFLFAFVKAKPFVSSTVEHMQNTALLTLAITLFYGLMLAVRTTRPEHYDQGTYDSLMVALLIFLHLAIFFVPLLSVGPYVLEMIQRTLTSRRGTVQARKDSHTPAGWSRPKRLSSLPTVHHLRSWSLVPSPPTKQDASPGLPSESALNPCSDAPAHRGSDARSDDLPRGKYRKAFESMHRNGEMSADGRNHSVIIPGLQVDGLNHGAHENLDVGLNDRLNTETSGSSAGASVELEARPLLHKPAPSPPESAWLSVSEPRDEIAASADGGQDCLVLGSSRGSEQESTGNLPPSRRNSSSLEKLAHRTSSRLLLLARREQGVTVTREEGALPERGVPSRSLAPAVVVSASAEIGFPAPDEGTRGRRAS